MPRNTTLDSILAAGELGIAYRVLSVDLNWPTPYSEPPFSGGARVSVPVIGTPPAYDADTFDAAVWTDVTALITSYRYVSSLDQACGALSLAVVARWDETDLDRAFRAMRAIIVQEQYAGTGGATGWVNVCFCISTGYAVEWIAGEGRQGMTVNALDALMLAKLDLLGGEDGYALYQADLVAVGSYSSHYDMPLVKQSDTDAWEFGVTSWPGGPHANPHSTSASAGKLVDSGAGFTAAVNGQIVTAVKAAGNVTATITAVDSSTQLSLSADIFDAADIPYFIGAVQVNWADRPGPQAWIENVPDTTIPVPATSGGDAVQALHGEGVIRIGKGWARTDPGDPADYGAGLGFETDDIPDVRCVLFRFAHPAGYTDSGGLAIPTDIATDLEQLADPPVAGEVTVTGDLSALPQGLTLILEDGSGSRYATSSHAVAGGNTTFTLVDTAAEIATGTACRYGEVNLAEDVVRRWLYESGFHADGTDTALFAKAPDQPTLNGSGVPILLPPLSYQDLDGQSRLDAIIDLRQNHAVLPNWITRSDPDGQAVTENIVQRFDSASGPHADVIPLPRALVNRAARDATDLNVFTRVVAYGRAHQIDTVTDIGKHPTVTILDVAEAAGGLPTVNASKRVTVDGNTYTLQGLAKRSGAAGDSYNFPLEHILQRDLAITTDGKGLRPFGWYFHAPETVGGAAASRRLRNAWCGKALCEITLPARERIAGIELHAPNTWWSDTHDWGGDRHSDDFEIFGLIKRKAHADGGRLRIDYFDYTLGQYMPLTDQVYLPVAIDAFFSISVEDFNTRSEVETDKLRLVCVEPFWAECGTANQDYYHSVIGMYLFNFRAIASSEVRGAAEIGVDAPFTGAAWEAARSRFRRRTYIVPEVADWASTPEQANALALEWLYHVTRNLSPRPVTAVRPDVAVGDSVRMALPVSELVSYGDDDAQLSGWSLAGLSLDNSDDLVCYWSLSDSDGDRTVNLYSDSGRTALVASGTRTGDGTILLIPENGSRLSGLVTVAYTGDETGTIGAPTYLVISTEHSGQAGQPGPQSFQVTNYLEPYFGED